MGLVEAVATRPAIALAMFAFIAHAAWSAAISKAKLPDTLPWVGKTEGVFSETRATLASLSNVRAWLADGYDKYSKRRVSYVFPDFSCRNEILIPNKKLHWLVNHPDSVASVREAHYDLLQGVYAFTTPYVHGTVFHEHVIHKNLARRIADVLSGMWDELCYTIDQTWGVDTGKRVEIPVMDNIMDLVSRVSNRTFVGLPLCRNKDFL